MTMPTRALPLLRILSAVFDEPNACMDMRSLLAVLDPSLSARLTDLAKGWSMVWALAISSKDVGILCEGDSDLESPETVRERASDGGDLKLGAGESDLEPVSRICLLARDTPGDCTLGRAWTAFAYVVNSDW